MALLRPVLASRRLLLVSLALLCCTVRTEFACLEGGATCDALADLYQATGGAEWTSRSGWGEAAAGTPTSFCSFHGALCKNGTLVTLCVGPVPSPHVHGAAAAAATRAHA